MEQAVAAYFFDSSALVTGYAREAGTTWVMSLFMPATNRIYVAHITVVEVVAALSVNVRVEEDANRPTHLRGAVLFALQRVTPGAPLRPIPQWLSGGSLPTLLTCVVC
jgi:hypothetical protein